MIEVKDLVYDYPTKRALHGVSLTIAPGRITALVGPNGAGKTTLLRCLAALEMPYAGSVRIDGLDTRDHPRKIHEKLGYLPDFFGLYDELTVRQCLTYAALSHGLGRTAAEPAVQAVAQSVGLVDRMSARASELSRGLRQRLAIAQAIVHRPKVVLLDEPAAGLDPQARRDLSDLLLKLKRDGLTLVVSSHILAELQDYSDHMVIIDNGRLAGDRALDGKGPDAPRYQIALAEPKSGLAKALEAHNNVSEVSAREAEALFRFSGDATARAALLRALIAEGFAVCAFGEARQSLEDAYFEDVRKARGQ